MKHKESSQTFQDFVRFLKKNRFDPNILGESNNHRILIVKKLSLKDIFPNKIREEIRLVLNDK